MSARTDYTFDQLMKMPLEKVPLRYLDTLLSLQQGRGSLPHSSPVGGLEGEAPGSYGRGATYYQSAPSAATGAYETGQAQSRGYAPSSQASGPQSYVGPSPYPLQASLSQLRPAHTQVEHATEGQHLSIDERKRGPSSGRRECAQKRTTVRIRAWSPWAARRRSRIVLSYRLRRSGEDISGSVLTVSGKAGPQTDKSSSSL